MTTWIFVISIILASLAFAAAIVFCVLSLLKRIGNLPGGFGPLADKFPETGELPQKVLKRQTVKIGLVTYKRCATIGIGLNALHLHAWGRKARIPWTEIKSVGSTRFQWSDWPVLVVGDPAISAIMIPKEALTAMRDKLPPGISRSS